MDKFAIVLRKKEAVMHEFTPDGLMFAYGIGIAFAVGMFYVLAKAAGNDGIAVLPDGLLFGFWGLLRCLGC